LIGASSFAATSTEPAAQGQGSLALHQPPIALARILAVEGGVDDAVVLCAAVLHDTVEDTETSHEELAAQFGRETADVVSKSPTTRPAEGRAQAAAGRARRACRTRPSWSSSPTRSPTCATSRTIRLGMPLERRREYFDWAKRVVDGCAARTAGSRPRSTPPTRAGPERLESGFRFPPQARIP